jgi:hypothetical protein
MEGVASRKATKSGKSYSQLCAFIRAQHCDSERISPLPSRILGTSVMNEQPESSVGGQRRNRYDLLLAPTEDFILILTFKMLKTKIKRRLIVNTDFTPTSSTRCRLSTRTTRYSTTSVSLQIVLASTVKPQFFCLMPGGTKWLVPEASSRNRCVTGV